MENKTTATEGVEVMYPYKNAACSSVMYSMCRSDIKLILDVIYGLHKKCLCIISLHSKVELMLWIYSTMFRWKMFVCTLFLALLFSSFWVLCICCVCVFNKEHFSSFQCMLVNAKQWAVRSLPVNSLTMVCSLTCNVESCWMSSTQ